MISKELLEKIYDSAYVQRWNDKFRPIEFTELDKQAHKMTIAYLFGKFDEGKVGFSWKEIIEAGLFDFLQRLVLTDLKPQLQWKVQNTAPNKYIELNKWVFENLHPFIEPLGQDFCNKCKNHFLNPSSSNLNGRIVAAAHLYSSKWEFDFIQRANPDGYEIHNIKKDFRLDIERDCDLTGMKSLVLFENYRNFVEFCGLLRFQYRWGHLYRIPRTSVLGHMLIVAMLSYLFSLEIHACEKRCVNNYFTGLFHDLPEVLTRDVITPIKRSVPGLDALIKKYERQQMKEKVFPLLPENWIKEFKNYALNEFENLVELDGRYLHPRFETINSKYNSNEYNPRDGNLVKACDTLAAFLEAHLAIKNGIVSPQLIEGRKQLKDGKDGKGGLEHSVLMKREFGDIHSLLQEMLSELS